MFAIFFSVDGHLQVFVPEKSEPTFAANSSIELEDITSDQPSTSTQGMQTANKAVTV